MEMSGSELDSKSGARVEDNREETRVSGDATETKAEVSSGELDLRATGSEDNARVIGNEGSENGGIARVRVSQDNVAHREMGRESRVVGGNSESNSSSVQLDLENNEFDPEEEISNEKSDKVEVYSSLLSEFDDFVANERHGALAATSRALSYGFEVGDLVWGKVKSHPWWPGHIFNEAFASSSVRRTRRDGHVLVAFFGDSSYGWFDPAELIPFDPHFAEKSQQTNSRNFVKAVEEAVDEASRRCGLGLVCKCRNRHNFRHSKEQGYFLVDVPEYEPAGVYSEGQINKARDAFQPVETLAFVKQLASEPGGSDSANIDFIKNKATIFAFRRVVFEKEDMTYAQAFGMQPRAPNETANVTDQPVKEPTRGNFSNLTCCVGNIFCLIHVIYALKVS
uniref:PWWP domain-containing protein n=1 Tax=Rhizophora mucronata TaxID=61149 RepID=A0A2P2IRL5_RHIMU